MAFFAAFVGGFYQARAQVFAADQAVNIYSETRGLGGSAKQITLYGTPGLIRQTTVSGADSRGAYAINGRSWRVVGATLYERLSETNHSAIATIPVDGLPVFFTSNGEGGDQLVVSGGGVLTVVDLVTGDVTVPTLPFVGPVTVAFLDGYVLCNQLNSPIVWYSALEDATSWDALDFFTRSWTADNVIAIGVSQDRVRCWGSQTTTEFYNSGDTDTPFLPYPGTTVQVGLVSPSLLGLYSDNWFWVAETVKGQWRIVMGRGAETQDIATPPILTQLAACPTLADAYLQIYEQESHIFVTVVLPSNPHDIKAYSYDVGEKQWHARADWDAQLGVYTQWRVRGIVAVNGQILGGDYQSGDIYELDLNTYSNDGDILKRERTIPYLSTENQLVFLDQFELGMQPGEGISSGQGVSPTATLEISRDGARTWVDAGMASLGAVGEYLDRCIWRRLGRARSDRLVVRVTQTDPVKCAWIGAWLRMTPGTGQL